MLIIATNTNLVAQVYSFDSEAQNILYRTGVTKLVTGLETSFTSKLIIARKLPGFKTQ